LSAVIVADLSAVIVADLSAVIVADLSAVIVADSTGVHPACPMKRINYFIGVEFTIVTVKFTPLNLFFFSV
jgi:hypothetical protein